MSNQQIIASKKVPLGQKIAFGLGMLANQMFPAALGIFAVILVEKLGFSGVLQGVAFFLPKFYDALLDLVMGYVSDNTKSKWGRRRQYVLAGAIILGISFALMWQMYEGNSVTYNFIYFLGISFIFYSGLTIFSIPYVAMGYEMSDDFHERTNIMATSQLIGQLAWVISPWFYVLMYNTDLFPSGMVSAVRNLSLYVAIGSAILAAIPAFFIPSKSTLNENYSPIDLKGILGSFGEIKEGLKASVEIIPFRKICIATFLIFNAFQTTAGFSYFLIKYYVFKGNEDGIGLWPTLFGCIGAIITTIVVIPIVARMSKVMGKKKAFLVSQGISVFGYILLYLLFVPGKPYLFLFALPFFSFGIGSLFTLMMSMTSDVIDIDELNTGKRREGSLGAIYWWMVKFGTAVAALLSGIILSLVNFQPKIEAPSDTTMSWLLISFVGIPILGTLTAMWAMKDYDVDEAKAREVRDLLEKKKAPKASGYGANNVMGMSLAGLSKSEIEKKFPQYYHSSTDYSLLNKEQLHAEFMNVFNSGMQGICFSAFTEKQFPEDEITEDQIRKRLQTLQSHTEWIRVFSSTHGHENIPKIAKEMGFKVLLGAWIGKDETENQKEIQSLIRLMNEGNVDLAAVGNEVLFRGDQNEETLLKYIQQVKSQTQNISVTYVDVYYEIINHPKLAAASDKILINCYPFWEGASIQHSSIYLQEMYHQTKKIAGGKEIIIAETGWPSKGEKVQDAEPNSENLMRYFIEVQKWASKEQVQLFYFSSFDESWKIHFEGWAGTSWGLWDSNEKFKF